MASFIKSTLTALLAVAALAGCRANAAGPGYGYGGGYGYGPGPGGGYADHQAAIAYGEQGFQDGRAGRYWNCDSSPRRCGGGTSYADRAEAYYRDGWLQGWEARCRETRDSAVRKVCPHVLNQQQDRPRDGGWRRR